MWYEHSAGCWVDYKENEICLGMGVIQDGLPEEVAFKCWEQRQEMRRMLAEVHKFVSYPWPCSIVRAKSRFEPRNSSTLATSCEELAHWKRPWCWEGLEAGGEGDNRGWDGWMASLARWMNSGSWWWTGRPGVLWFMGSQESDTTERLNWTSCSPSRSSALSLHIVSSLSHRYTHLHIQTLKGYIVCSFLACRCFLQGKQWLLMTFLVLVILKSLYRSNVVFGGSLATCLFLSVSESISLRATGASCQPEINRSLPQDKCV